MAKESSGKSNETKSNDVTRHSGTTALRPVIDPAERYYDESLRKREAYRKALSQGEQNFWSGDGLAAQTNHRVMGEEGTSQSRSGFDYRTFRKS